MPADHKSYNITAKHAPPTRSPPMPRLVHHDQTGPYEVKPQEQSVWICGCGLSQNLPYCDGSHKKARKEEAGKLYVYDAQCSNVVEVKDQP